MPQNSPGTLSRQENADLIAFVLQFNRFPSGKEELPRDSQTLQQILIKASKP